MVRRTVGSNRTVIDTSASPFPQAVTEAWE